MFATVTSGGADVPGGKCPVTGQTGDDVLRLISRSMSSVIDDKPVRHKCIRRQRQQPQTQQRVGIKINKTGKMYFKKLQQVATVIVATERIATAAQIDPSSSPDGANV